MKNQLLNYGTDIIGLALAEDIGSGDLTSLFFIDKDRRSEASILAKEEAIVAGIEVAYEVFKRLDNSLEMKILKSSGTSVAAGDSVLRISGSTRSILTGERTALNFLQRLSGVATTTREFVNTVRGYPVQILDTRKTTPGFRLLEKAAVRAGGGMNYRMGLYDMVMVKDNHLLATNHTESLTHAIAELKKSHPKARVELEADTLGQVECFLKIPQVDVILLDNMSCEMMAEAVVLAKGSGIKLEASGGIRLERLKEIAATGVDYISAGALTHSARSIDFSLDIS